MPNNPFIDAGSRIEPPVSDPIEPKTTPAPTAAPEPLDDPPEIRSASQLLQQSPKCGFLPVGPATISFMFSGPMSTAPASSRDRRRLASRNPGVCPVTMDPTVIGSPARSKQSLCASTIPCKGPRSSPRASSRSLARAVCKAFSSRMAIKALMTGCDALARATESVVNCSLLNRPARSIAAISRIGRSSKSLSFSVRMRDPACPRVGGTLTARPSVTSRSVAPASAAPATAAPAWVVPRSVASALVASALAISTDAKS